MSHHAESTGRTTEKRPGVAHKLAGHATSRLSGQKDRLADQMSDVVEAMRQAARALRGSNPRLARIAETSAGRVEGWAAGLHDRDIQQLLGEVRTFARKQPALFIGASVVLGIVAARVLKNLDADDDGSFGDDGRRGGVTEYADWSRDARPRRTH